MKDILIEARDGGAPKVDLYVSPIVNDNERWKCHLMFTFYFVIFYILKIMDTKSSHAVLKRCPCKDGMSFYSASVLVLTSWHPYLQTFSY